jgi:hypothetical protein
MKNKSESQEVEERRLMLMAAAEQWEADLGVVERDRFETPWAFRGEASVSIDMVSTRGEGEVIL